ncbi:hypothetical protein [Aquimarina agarivorans]|uniref:hypothetical protein n=1 Tax=Aquimarina agarivorans TaxID=980584 RepID=UPI000248FC58|nr:hypothetical protein [Aquimarina agarivorans]
MDISKTTWWMIGGAGVAALGIGAFWIISIRLKKQKKASNDPTLILGKGKQIDLSARAGTRKVPNWNNAFDMNYTAQVKQWLQPKSILELDEATAKKYAKQIKNAKGTFNDDEEIIALIFYKRLRDKTNVSSISKAFWSLYKMDMWQYLNSFLSKSEVHRYLTQPIKQLPNYTIA